MLRHYFITDDLNELAIIENELEDEGFTEPQIHVLSLDHASMEQHHLNEVDPLFKKNVIRGTGIGAGIGSLLALITLIIAYIAGWYYGPIAWEIFILIACCCFLFCTWKGVSLGLKEPNARFVRFQQLLNKGKHILLVDVEPVQEHNFRMIMNVHPRVKAAGCGAATPHWIVSCQDTYNNMMKRKS